MEVLANGELLDFQYRDHRLTNDKVYKNCRECHIELDWLLIYRYDGLTLLLLAMEVIVNYLTYNLFFDIFYV